MVIILFSLQTKDYMKLNIIFNYLLAMLSLCIHFFFYDLLIPLNYD